VPGTRSTLPSVTAITLRRGLSAGKLYLAIALVISLVLTIVLLRSAKGPTTFETAFPLEIPLFASLGGIGGIMLFVSDRSKGVLEYVISYGMRPGRLFLNYLLTTAGLSSLVLVIILAIGLGGFVGTGNSISTDLANSILGYTIPMTYASALFAATCGMVWSTISTPRMGLNSPVGVAPLLGVAPPVLILLLAETVAKSEYYYVTVGAAAGFIVLVFVLLGASARLMGRERYLSPV
jgi:hypothetical protein